MAEETQSKNDINEIKERLKIRIEKETFETISNIKKIYVVCFIIFVLLLIVNIAFLVLKIPLVFKILLWILSVPSFLTLLVFVIIRMWLFGDWRTLKGHIILKVTANYLIANFFLTQKRIVKRIVLLNSDGISFYYADGLYNVDGSAIYLDEENRPNSYYIPNMPNPLKFDFFTYLKKGLENFRKNDIENFNDDIDVIYSAENLKIFKKDKFLQELHRDSSEQLTKMMYIIIGVCVVAMIAIIIVVALMNKSPNVTVVNNVTSAVKPNF